MINKNDMQKDVQDGDCLLCQGHSMWGRTCGRGHWGHIIIKILVALFIFWAGVQFGELKSVLRAAYSNYGYGMMSSYGGNEGQSYYYGPSGMMGGWFAGAVSQSTTTKNQ
jgi:hypothetical protein